MAKTLQEVDFEKEYSISGLDLVTIRFAASMFLALATNELTMRQTFILAIENNFSPDGILGSIETTDTILGIEKCELTEEEVQQLKATVFGDDA